MSRAFTPLAVISITAVARASYRQAPSQVANEVRVVKAGAATIQVVIRGRGDPIVFIPSRGRGTADFDDLSRRLVSAGYQAILPQPRGVGGSTGPLDSINYHDLASDVAATIREVVGGPATILGHAFGGRVARTLAADHPHLVKRLILVALAGPVPRSAAVREATDRVFDPALSPELRFSSMRFAFFAKRSAAAVWREGWFLDAAVAQRAADNRTPLHDWWAGGTAPILVLQGTQDLITVPENARRLAREFPERVSLVEIPNAGHAMLPEQPDRIAAAILTYSRLRP